MNALIIGAGGFVGHYLIEELLKHYPSLYVTILHHEVIIHEDENIISHHMDITDKDEVDRVIGQIKPDVIIHLAAQSSVGLSWKNPSLTMNVNILGTINVLDAVIKHELKSRLLLIGSSEQYGKIDPALNPVLETTDLHPANPYAVSKMTQEMIAGLYMKKHPQLEIICTRSFNHIGPFQLPGFVVPDFCRQIALIEKGKQKPVMITGNLDAKRDFSDVRDVVQAYKSILEKGQAGEIYNVGSGTSYSISDILQKLLSLSNADIKIEKDKDKMRPSENPEVKASISKIQSHTGWKPQYSIETSLLDTLNWWRDQPE